MGGRRRPGDVLIIGASGQVGRACQEVFVRRGHQVQGTYAHHPREGLVALELADEEKLRAFLSESAPRVCILSSALTQVDACEDEPSRAQALNARAPKVVAEACESVGTQLVYLSTEYVFDGRGGPYLEDDAPAPLGVYGATKWEGEKAVLSTSPTALVVRTTVVYSYQPEGKNFLMQLWTKLRQGQRMNVPVDQISSPTYAPELAEAIADLLACDARGIFHVAGPEVMGRYAFAVRAAEVLGLDPGLLTPVQTSALGQKARRPLQAGLRIDRLRALLGERMSPVEGSLQAFAAMARGT